MKSTTLAADTTAWTLDEDGAWKLLRALAARASTGAAWIDSSGLRLDERGAAHRCAPERGLIVLRPDLEQGWEPGACAIDAAASTLLDLYAPLCVGRGSASLVVAHLGQSLDGRVATVTGASQFVTGPEDLRHTHRLRALFDAVVIGARTAELDDPRLTTRLVPGRQPTRVVIDPQARLDPRLRLLSDGAAPTLLISARGARTRDGGCGAHVELLQLASDGGALPARAVLDALRARGLSRIFIEGGGITVSRFLQAGLLDRLQIAVAPKIIGSGTPALQLPPIEHMADAISTRCRRFLLGSDVLFDCDLRAEPW